MKPDAVIDTDVISFIFKESRFGDPYIKLVGETNPIISFMTVAEIALWAIRGNWQMQRRMQMEKFLPQFAVYESDRQLGERWAEVIEIGYKVRKPVSCADAWIAATALELNCPLITHNVSDFRRIPGLEILTANAS